ncbi:MAG: diguanylate cyclase [Bdellovibrionia bacterium]
MADDSNQSSKNPSGNPSAQAQDDRTDKTTVLQRGVSNTLSVELQKAKEQEACLIIIRGTPQGSRFFLTQPEMILGRDLNAEISISDQSVSRKHARITKSAGQVRLCDLGSSNGTFINDKKLNPHQDVILSKEDMIKIGNSIFKFLPAGEIEILFYGNLGSAAHTDSMTQIYNKGYLLEALEAEFKRAKALHTDLSVIFFDLDHFKKINDTYGHDGGDFVLKELTQLIRTTQIRPKDVFARYGGEEFVILLGNTALKFAVDLAERIRASIEAHAFIYEGKRIPVTVSMGVAELRAGVEASSTLLKAADQALYVAKSQGRNRVESAP